MPPTHRWTASEKHYFIEVTNNLVISIGWLEPNMDDWLQVMHDMTMEQARHLPGGAEHMRDPWPPRIYTQQSVKGMWRRLKGMREEVNRQAAEQLMQEFEQEMLDPEILDPLADAEQEFEAGLPEEWRREFEEQLAPLRAQWAEEAQLAAENEAAQQILFDNRPVSPHGDHPQGLIAIEAAAELHQILLEPVAGPTQIEISRELLERMSANQATQDNFWNQFHERFGNQ